MQRAIFWCDKQNRLKHEEWNKFEGTPAVSKLVFCVFQITLSSEQMAKRNVSLMTPTLCVCSGKCINRTLGSGSFLRRDLRYLGYSLHGWSASISYWQILVHFQRECMGRVVKGQEGDLSASVKDCERVPSKENQDSKSVSPEAASKATARPDFMETWVRLQRLKPLQECVVNAITDYLPRKAQRIIPECRRNTTEGITTIFSRDIQSHTCTTRSPRRFVKIRVEPWLKYEMTRFLDGHSFSLSLCCYFRLLLPYPEPFRDPGPRLFFLATFNWTVAKINLNLLT